MEKKKRKAPPKVGKRHPDVPRVGKDKVCYLKGPGLDQHHRSSLKITKLHAFEREAIQLLADTFTGGNVSAWIRHCSLTYRPTDAYLLSKIDPDQLQDLEFQLECLQPMPGTI